MPTMDTDTTDTHMPTMDWLTMARDLLMLSQRLMLISLWILWLWTPPICPPWILRIPICPPWICLLARDLLMLRPMLMLTTDTHMPMVMDMPTADTTDTHTLTDGESKMLTKS